MKKHLLFGILFSFIASVSHAQLISIAPSFATADDNNVVITFDASQGNAGLLGQSTIYAHTGVITSASTSSSDWRYVIATWTTNLPKALLTRIGSSNQYVLNIGNIRTFYGVPANETVLRLAFVFRNTDGSKTGKTSAGGDIFIDINQGNFQVKINTPIKASFFAATDSFNVSAGASAAANLKLFANGNQVASVQNSISLSYKNTLLAFGNTRVTFVLEGDKNGTKSYDTSYIMPRLNPSIENSPAGITDGINVINDSTVILQLFAPFKNYVYVIGDFNNWEYHPSYLMKRTPDGSRYWISLTGLNKSTEYGFQYSIDDAQLKVADVYAEKLLDPWNDQWIPAVTYPNLKPYPTGKTTEVVSVLQIEQPQYSWRTNNFVKPLNDKLVIYELLVRDFIGRHDFKTLRDTISYLKRVGANCVKIMPIMEFEGNESWGYNPMFYFAVDKYYGTKNDFKAFVDECHANGIAVVLDIALNHSFGQNPQVRMYFNPAAGDFGQPTAQNPWFNQTDKHPFGVGYDYNHEAQIVKEFTDRVLKFWITEYKIDGYRFDLSKGFTQKNTLGDVGAWSAYDQSRVDIWNRIRSQIITYAPDAYLILEHLGDNSEETVLANMGFMLWGKMTESFAEATMGYNNSKANLSWGNYKSRGWNFPNLVTYAESHDEERIMHTTLNFGNASGGYSTKNLSNALKRVAAYHALLLPLKGPKMLWQGGELGYEVSINTNGRTGNKPFRWEYLSNSERVATLNQVGMLARLKQHVSFGSDNYTYDVAGTGKILKVNHDSMNTLIAGNFDVVSLNLTPGFQKTGWWYNYITGDSINVTNTGMTISLQPGAYVVYTDVKLASSNNQQPSGLTEETSSTFSDIYPNPAKNTLNIQALKQNITHIKLLDLSGKEVINQHHHNNLVNLDISHITPGLYLIQISYETHVETRKIIIE
ncbi:MAG: alpha-amylase family glycosyl hydrolase [Bacteroidia bacterium]|nr:alpha-amylase family glycosyl hydrolase [Bacteroidia bacterium]